MLSFGQQSHDSLHPVVANKPFPRELMLVICPRNGYNVYFNDDGCNCLTWPPSEQAAVGGGGGGGRALGPSGSLLHAAAAAGAAERRTRHLQNEEIKMMLPARRD